MALALWQVKPALAPEQKAKPSVTTHSATKSQTTFIHEQIVATEFWVGEPADADNAGITNTSSTWDENWQQHYGGIDDPADREGYAPAAFTPLQNPFYAALPYSDFDSQGNRKASASNCLQLGGNANSQTSWCKNNWIAITYGEKTAYVQWEDAGPFGENDTSYVFGTGRPQNKLGAGASIDLSPATGDYLGLSGLDKVNWHFVRYNDVPNGPWKQIITNN